MRPLAILYGSQTGGAQEAAESLGRQGRRRGFAVRVDAMDDYPISSLPDEPLVVYVASTTGDGEAPDNMATFWRFMLRKSLPADALASNAFAVLGLGDSSYPKYNAAARRLRSRLVQLGAREICPLGLADDQSVFGPENDVSVWAATLWRAALERFPLPPGFIVDDAPTALRPAFALQPIGEGAAAAPGATSFYAPPAGSYRVADGLIAGHVVCNRRLTDDAWTQDVRHIEVDIADAAQRGLRYEAGDVAVVYGRNVLDEYGGPDAVARMLALPALSDGSAASVSTRYRVVAAAAAAAAVTASSKDDVDVTDVVDAPRWLPATWSVAELLTQYLDVLGTPRRYFFEQLSFWAHNAEEKEKLLELGVESASDRDAASLLNEYCTREKRSYIEVLQDFPSASANLPLAQLIALVPQLRPRYFSIASTQSVHPTQVHLTVAIVHYTTAWYKREKWGACSKWLAAQTQGAPLALWIVKGKMRLPPNPATPLVLVGPGTGVAPMKAMVEERGAQLRELVAAAAANPALPPLPPPGSCTLYFGCRHAAMDFLYEREGLWHALQQLLPSESELKKSTPAPLTALRTAFSRDQPRKIYVQARIRENARAVWSALAPPAMGGSGGHCFVAGSTKMASDVHEALIDVFVAAGGVEKAQAAALLRRMGREGRYVCESWS